MTAVLAVAAVAVLVAVLDAPTRALGDELAAIVTRWFQR